MNGALRGDKPLSKAMAKRVQDMDNMTNRFGIESKVRNIEPSDGPWREGLNHQTSGSTPATVFRGIDQGNSFKIGEVIRDKGFVSTSIDPKVAVDFASKTGSKTATILAINLPRGARFMPFSTEEREVILPRGTAMRITGSSNPVPGVTVLHTEVVI